MIGEAMGQQVVDTNNGFHYMLTDGPFVVTLLVGTIYFTLTEGSGSGQSLGKKLAGLRVIDFNTGGPIGYGRAFLRQIGKLISFIPLGLGFFWMLWDGQKQTWGDKMATSIVVPNSAYPIN
ncbi:MAG: hypothetical protein QOG54_1874 [Actinomycetota bacterium]|nr:hypothetical protein [Actinomycetota bacterium]